MAAHRWRDDDHDCAAEVDLAKQEVYYTFALDEREEWRGSARSGGEFQPLAEFRAEGPRAEVPHAVARALAADAGVPDAAWLRGVELAEAARNDEVEAVRRLLAGGAPAAARFAGASVLARACERGRYAVALALVEHGADVHEVTRGSGGIIHIVCRTGEEWGRDRASIPLLTRLLERGVEPDAAPDGRFTPLITVAASGGPEAAKLLLARGARRDGLPGGESPLHWAASFGNAGVVRVLLDAGAEREGRDRTGRTPLMVAAERGQIATTELLLERGADPAALLAQKDGEPHWQRLPYPIQNLLRRRLKL